jgi:excisionase family DNA binding protein
MEFLPTIPDAVYFASVELLTTSQAAKKLKVTPRRVIALIEAGRLPASKLGRDYLIQAADLARVQHRRPGRPRKNSK